MKKITLLSIIFSCLLGTTFASYQNQIDTIWDNTVREIDAGYVGTLESKELLTKLEKASEKMEEGETLLVNFYPEGSGFDALMEENFITMKEFKEKITELGFKIEFSYPQRHMAEFKDEEELSAYLKEKFNGELKAEDAPLRFPTLIVTAKLQKI